MKHGTRPRVVLTIVRQRACAALSDAQVRRIVTATLMRGTARTAAAPRTYACSIAFVSAAAIRTLNRRYRGKDAPTDVLSFPAGDQASLGRPRATRDLGDIIIACAVVRRYATIDGVDVQCALVDTLAHGVLHVLGYRHSPRMFAIQNAIVHAYCDKQKAVHFCAQRR